MNAKSTPSDIHAQIEAYYDGSLTDVEVARLRARLAEDPALAAEAARYESLHRHGFRASAAEVGERDELRRRLRVFEAGLPPLTGLGRSLWPRIVSAAAAVLLLLAAGWWLLQRPDPAARLAEEYFVWLPREEAMLGPGEDAANGLAAYDRQEYELAYPLLLSGVANGVLDSVNLLYAGVAALGSDEPGKARRHLAELLETGRYPYEESDLRYYLGLAALRLNEPDEARRQLAAARDLPGRNASRAGDLLARLTAS